MGGGLPFRFLPSPSSPTNLITLVYWKSSPSLLSSGGGFGLLVLAKRRSKPSKQKPIVTVFFPCCEKKTTNKSTWKIRLMRKTMIHTILHINYWYHHSPVPGLFTAVQKIWLLEPFNPLRLIFLSPVYSFHFYLILKHFRAIKLLKMSLCLTQSWRHAS